MQHPYFNPIRGMVPLREAQAPAPTAPQAAPSSGAAAGTLEEARWSGGDRAEASGQVQLRPCSMEGDWAGRPRVGWERSCLLYTSPSPRDRG
eukprot:1827495-Rhodomonas_salina.4